MILTPNPALPRTPFNPGPVLSAGAVSDITVKVTPMPGMRGTLQGWFRAFTAKRVLIQHEEDGTVTTQLLPVNTSGVMQPSEFEELDIQLGGDRSWVYWTLHCTPELRMETNDQVLIRDMNFRVLGRKDYTINGYIEYRLVESPRTHVPRS